MLRFLGKLSPSPHVQMYPGIPFQNKPVSKSYQEEEYKSQQAAGFR